MLPKLGILAGGGVLPRRLIEAARRSGREFHVIGFTDQTDAETLAGNPHTIVRLGAGGDLISSLKKAGVSELVMAGHIRRPSLKELRPDWRTTKFFTRHALSSAGDDALLKAVRRELESEGFTLVGPQHIMAELLTPPGYLGLHRMDEVAERDLTRAAAILQALSPHDVGQAVVVQQGLVLGIEAIEGTAALLARTAGLKRDGLGGVLVKLAKAQQENIVDLPAIGPDTMAQAEAAGLRGIVIQAGRSLLLDRAETVTRADAAGLFVYGMPLHD